MSNITIDQLEPDLSQRLEQRAAQHGRTRDRLPTVGSANDASQILVNLNSQKSPEMR